eukprot:1195491-Prorocentrum_minimum.AAC.5
MSKEWSCSLARDSALVPALASRVSNQPTSEERSRCIPTLESARTPFVLTESEGERAIGVLVRVKIKDFGLPSPETGCYSKNPESTGVVTTQTVTEASSDKRGLIAVHVCHGSSFIIRCPEGIERRGDTKLALYTNVRVVYAIGTSPRCPRLSSRVHSSK